MPLRTWTAPGLSPVQAHTKGEARALFRRQLQENERLSFKPKVVKRLPPGLHIRRVQ